ncbi:hypothetical protein ACLB2K_063527 [Fragaria x ananassa]
METSTTVQTKTRVMVAVDERDWSSYLLTWALDHLFINAPSTVEGSEAEAGTVTLVHVTQPFQHIVYPLGLAGATYNVSASVAGSGWLMEAALLVWGRDASPGWKSSFSI